MEAERRHWRQLDTVVHQALARVDKELAELDVSVVEGLGWPRTDGDSHGREG